MYTEMYMSIEAQELTTPQLRFLRARKFNVELSKEMYVYPYDMDTEPRRRLLTAR
jgi:hypothetical protein